jgi:hypothetical protein
MVNAGPRTSVPPAAMFAETGGARNVGNATLVRRIGRRGGPRLGVASAFLVQVLLSPIAWAADGPVDPVAVCARVLARSLAAPFAETRRNAGSHDLGYRPGR